MVISCLQIYRLVGPALVAVGLLGIWFAPPGYPQGPAPKDIARNREGLYITVPVAITDGAVKKIKDRVEAARQHLKKVIFDFNPQGQPSASSNFGSCNDLAEYIRALREKNDITTVAFVAKDVGKHTVLPALACSELVMAENAKIGDVLRDQGALNETARTAYEHLTTKHSWALVFKMIQPTQDIIAVPALGYLTPKEWEKKKEELAKQGKEIKPLPTPEVLRNGQPFYTTKDALAVYLVKSDAVRNTPDEVVRFYKLPRTVLTEVWLGDRTPVVGVVEARGQLDKGKIQSLDRRIGRALGRGVNFLILVLECEGGDDTDAAWKLGDKLVLLRDGRWGNVAVEPVRTLAYVPSKRSLGAATYLALGCGEIVMASDAVLADFEYKKTEKDSDHKGRRDQLAELAQKQGYSPALFEAALDRDLVVYQAETKSGDKVVITKKQWDQDKEAGHTEFKPGAARIVKKEGTYLKLDAELAKELRVVEFNAVNSLEALYALNPDIDPAKVTVFRDDWLDILAEFFRGPLVKLVLIMIGILGMILELKMPGATLPGIVAAICFVLFFWAHSFIGEYTMLAVLLFVLGLILLGVEIFVFPGFGLPGIAGILLVVGSLVIVTLEKMPTTPAEWVSLGFTLTTFGVSLVAAIAGAFMLAWYLPHIPYASRLLLPPPTEPAPGSEGAYENPLASLLGAIGVAETPLRPAGKARFGDDFLDVIAEGDFLNPGSRVQVIEVEGQRIVVKEV